jgi:sulfite exporter TauE/SafE
MCGGLVAATCQKSSEVVRYQLGRLLGYLLLGALAGALGALLHFRSLPFYYSLIPAIFIGTLFIYWGVQSFRGKKAELPLPKFYHKIYGKLWSRLVFKNEGYFRSFFTGFISILLPCGLLYGVILGTVALQRTSDALLSMFFFWLGTVPSMVVAPQIVQRFLRPLKARLPRTYAVSLVLIGVMTITFRVAKLHSHSTPSRAGQQHMSCH